MNVFVELDADPPRLRRDDGLIVRFPRAENGTFAVIEVGRLGKDDSFKSLFRWQGFPYQELQPGKDAALLVGHLPEGYCSAAVMMDARSVTLEFADRVAEDKSGVQRVATEFFVHDSCDVVVSVGDETSFSADVDDAPGGSLHHLRVERDKSKAAVETQLRVMVSRER